MKYLDKNSHKHKNKVTDWSRPTTEREQRRSVKKGTDALFQRISEIDNSYWSRTLTNEDKYEIYREWRWKKDEYVTIEEVINHFKTKYGDVKKARELKIKDLLQKS